METLQTNTLEQWIADKWTIEQVKSELQAMGFEEDQLEENLNAYKKVHYAKRQMNGILYISMGAVLGFVGCVVSIINPLPDYYYWILYGPTLIAAGLIFYGLYNIFE
jgi:hypothetical protein